MNRINKLKGYVVERKNVYAGLLVKTKTGKICRGMLYTINQNGLAQDLIYKTLLNYPILNVEPINSDLDLAIEDNRAIGLIMGTIPKYDKYDYLDYKCPKRGEITELIVTSKTRSKGVGKALINKIEEYFKSLGCEYVLVDVFAYNKNAIKFYENKGYHSRMYTNIKKL